MAPCPSPSSSTSPPVPSRTLHPSYPAHISCQHCFFDAETLRPRIGAGGREGNFHPAHVLRLRFWHGMVKTSSIYTYRMSLDQRVRLLPSPVVRTSTSNNGWCRLTKQTNPPPTPSSHPYLLHLPTKILYHQALGRYLSRPPSTRSHPQYYSSAQ